MGINSEPCSPGDVQVVRVLGVFALIDGEETDWKLVVVNADSEETAGLRDVSDVPEEKLTEIKEWFRNYKTAEGKGLNRFGLDERVMDREYAMKIAKETNDLWKTLGSGAQHHKPEPSRKGRPRKPKN